MIALIKKLLILKATAGSTFFKPNFPNIGAKPMKNAAKRAKYNNSWKSVHA